MEEFNYPSEVSEKKKVYQNWWFWVIVVLAFIIIIQAALNGNSDTPAGVTVSESAADMSSTSKETTTIKETTTLAVTTTVLDEQAKSEYMAQCETITFKELARNPDSYVGKKLKIKGEVIQVSEGSVTTSLRINMTQGSYGYWTDTIYATVVIPDGNDRILEDDIITIYGECAGSYTYTATSGASITLPKINVKLFEIQE